MQRASGDGIRLRAYRHEDAAATLRIFRAAVMQTAAADYTPAQLAAWARPRPLPEWDAAMTARRSVVALVGDEVAGFSDVDRRGFIDMMFVDPRHGRVGVGCALLAEAERMARADGAAQLTADVSITARGFFQRHGFTVYAEQHPVVGGVRMTNFRMTRPLDPPA